MEQKVFFKYKFLHSMPKQGPWRTTEAKVLLVYKNNTSNCCYVRGAIIFL